MKQAISPKARAELAELGLLLAEARQLALDDLVSVARAILDVNTYLARGERVPPEKLLPLFQFIRECNQRKRRGARKRSHAHER